MKEAPKSLWRENKYCLESCRRAMPSFMVQTLVKGKGYKEGEGRREREEGWGGERERLCQVSSNISI